MDGTGIADPPNPNPAASPLVAVTGAGGFVGTHVLRALKEAGFRTRAVTRIAGTSTRRLPNADETVPHPGVSPQADWLPLLAGADAVVHLAGLAHMAMDSRPMRQSLRRINVLSTQQVALAAAQAGVTTFVFMSSIKAVADHSNEMPLTETSAPRPEDCYGLAKRAAERRLERLARQWPTMRMLILRPPLVYGPGVGANFAALMRLVGHGLPLPLGAVRNRRSLVYVGNLADAVVRCLERTEVPSGTFHLSDGNAVSTPELVESIARAQGRRARLLPVPPAWLGRAAALAGKRAQFTRVAGSLEVSNRRFCEAFDWEPPFTLEQGLRATLRKPQ
jgi:nucleoside-diphosphate-sugar epimerase